MNEIERRTELGAWHDTQHEKSMTLIRQENNNLSTNLK